MRMRAGLLVVSALTLSGHAGPPVYEIVDLGVIDPGDAGSQGAAMSPGGIGVGRTLGVSNQGWFGTFDGGLTPLPNLAGRPFGVANDANDSGVVVGTGAQTFFGSGALPLIWNNGAVSQLSLPAGEVVGRANGVNSDGTVVGSFDGGSAEQAAIWIAGVPQFITATGPGGTTMTTAFKINDSGLVVGNGTDPSNAARNVPLVYNAGSGVMIEIPALPGRNGGLAFDVSNAGHVVGSMQQNQGAGVPFIWSAASGTVAIPLPAGASQGSARGVNSDGWAVGVASTAFAVPFLYDGTTTYHMQDLLPSGTPWDLSTNTSSAVLGIAEDGTVVGTGVLGGEVRAFIARLVDDGCPADLAGGDGVLNIDDVLAFVDAFALGQPEADFAPPTGVLNIDDVIAYLDAFAAGCP